MLSLDRACSRLMMSTAMVAGIFADAIALVSCSGCSIGAAAAVGC